VEERFQFNNVHHEELARHVHLLCRARGVLMTRVQTKHFCLSMVFEQFCLGQCSPVRAQVCKLSRNDGAWRVSPILDGVAIRANDQFPIDHFNVPLVSDTEEENSDCCNVVILEFGYRYGDDIRYPQMGGGTIGSPKRAPLCSLYGYARKKTPEGLPRGNHWCFPVSCSWIGNYCVVSFGRLVGVGFGHTIGGFDNLVSCFKLASVTGPHRHFSIASYAGKWDVADRIAGSDVNGYSAIYHCFMLHNQTKFVLRSGLGANVMREIARMLGGEQFEQDSKGRWALADGASPVIDNDDLFPLVTCFEQLFPLEAGDVSTLVVGDTDVAVDCLSRAMYERLRYL
jgi:hypothetical protein